MGKSMRKRTILAKLESVYGTDPTPTGMANAMLVRNLNVQPLNAEVVSRDNIRPYLGNSESLVASAFATLDFEVELAGSGIPGAAPAWGPLLEACAFSKQLTTAAISITRSSTVATATLVGHGFAVGDTVRISGAIETEYNGDVVITDVPTVDTFTYTVSGTPDSPATGTPVVGRAAIYEPMTDNLKSMTIYFNLDGVLQKIKGARGTFEMGLSAKQIPFLKFTFTGLYEALTDTAAPTVDYSEFQNPKIANTLNTPDFALFGYDGCLESMNLNLGGDVQYRTFIGCESVDFVDRKPTGTFVMEMPSIATKDFFAIALAGDVGAMTLTHGTKSGNIVKIDAPRVSIQNPTIQESQGVAMISVPFVPVPVDGNDELTITCK